MALGRTSHLAIGAHADDVELFAVEGILACYEDPSGSFCAAVVSDGRGSPRLDGDGVGRSTPANPPERGEDLARVRREEQKKAALLGRYGAAVLLDYESVQVKDAGCVQVVDDLERLLRTTQPRVLYTHSPCDRHDTHVAVCLRVLEALVRLDPEDRPERLIGCEVWGDLDWVPRPHRVIMDVGSHLALQTRLIEAHRSQVGEGKRYDLAALGRRRAHATFGESHRVDRSEGVILGVDLLPVLSRYPTATSLGAAVEAYVGGLLEAFRQDMVERVRGVSR